VSISPGVNGLTFAVVDDQVTPQAAIGSRGMSVQAGRNFIGRLETIDFTCKF